MQKLLKLLKTFSEVELKEFEKFMGTPFSVQGRNSKKLYDYVIEYYPEFNSPKLNSNVIKEILFPDEEHKSKKLYNFNSDLIKSAEHFVAIKHFLNDQSQYDLYLSSAYMDRGILDEAHLINKKVDSKLKPSFSPSKDYLSKLNRLAHFEYNYYNTKKDFRNMSKCLNKIFIAVAMQFVFECMKLESNKDVKSLLLEEDDENKFIKKVIDTIDFPKLIKLFETDYIENPIVTLHYYKFKTSEKSAETDAYYYLLRDLLIEGPDIDREERWFFIIHLMNYCNLKISQNIEHFSNEALTICKNMLLSNSFSSSESKPLDIALYRNIILFCLYQNDWKFLNNLIKNYTRYLQPGNQSTMKNMASAYLNFIEGEFEESLNFINKIENFEIPIFKCDIKTLTLKVFYELNYNEEVLSGISAYREFLNKNNSIPDTHKKRIKNFLSLLRKLTINKTSIYNKNEMLFLEDKINREAHFVNKYWLLEKVNELMEEKVVA